MQNVDNKIDDKANVKIITDMMQVYQDNDEEVWTILNKAREIIAKRLQPAIAAPPPVDSIHTDQLSFAMLDDVGQDTLSCELNFYVVTIGISHLKLRIISKNYH